MHGALFKSSRANTWVGRIAGAVVFTPYEKWQWQHVHHHQVSGTEDSAEIDHGATTYWTTQQWRTYSKTKQAILRVMRDPFVYFTLIPGAVFLLFYRIPRLRKSRKAGRRTGVAFTNVFKAVELPLGLAVLGWAWLRCELLAIAFGAGIGFMLFHLQHHVNAAYRAPQSTHDCLKAALQGSTYVPIPWCLRWVTLGIEYHHIHHLSTQVPCYQLQACHEEAPEGCWDDVVVVTPLKALRSIFRVMWNAETRQAHAAVASGHRQVRYC
ncbi:hypothetical protein WJX72_002411 [[Myrmecia] bisecta]|uniref:Fatty acid desaturase domain-containing protein n=1 Tax=[Myrmecia] bisecta TaxID=41462 RepID=A0AAW1PT87_9CHLO